jgi:hypothetical protein
MFSCCYATKHTRLLATKSGSSRKQSAKRKRTRRAMSCSDSGLNFLNQAHTRLSASPTTSTSATAENAARGS